ncbi:ATP-binding protein [Streptomyces sp. NBC_00829]|uniref:ATP-binding protein n=1 Tax=Streptomyces sp. NBC_00829 TaxID=2903679 RepID=UPI00386934E2|nr:ATP-binding protein [Streptomyces sp. NBC_00829]
MRAEEPPCVWPLPHRSESAGTARRVTRAALAEWGMDKDTTEEIVLVVSELVTNAVEHALPPVALHLERSTEGTVHVKVDDGGPAAQEGAWATTGGQEEHGRGGGIVALLATAHGTHSLPAGTAYWADLPVAV